QRLTSCLLQAPLKESLRMLPRLLRYLSSFAPLTAVEELHRAADQRVLRFSAREDLLIPGEVSRYLLLSLDGIACRHSLLANGRHQITALLLPGDILGFEALAGWRCVDTVTALTSMHCL